MRRKISTSPRAIGGDKLPMTEVLAEPVLCASFWRNRSGEAIRVQLREFEGRAVVDVRVWVVDRSGVLRPSTSGVCTDVKNLDKLIRSLVSAQRRAQQLGLLPSSVPSSLAESRS
jgi:hypothetical protein